MTDEELLEKAIDFIVERENGDDYICETLMNIKEEDNICRETCDNLKGECVLRFLKYYKT